MIFLVQQTKCWCWCYVVIFTFLVAVRPSPLIEWQLVAWDWTGVTGSYSHLTISQIKWEIIWWDSTRSGHTIWVTKTDLIIEFVPPIFPIFSPPIKYVYVNSHQKNRNPHKNTNCKLTLSVWRLESPVWYAKPTNINKQRSVVVFIILSEPQFLSN